MKIGVLTQYCNSRNYGGNLQAFALEFFLNKNGFNTEQISLSLSGARPFHSRKKTIFRFFNPKKITRYVLYRFKLLLGKIVLKSKIASRTFEIDSFNKEIPHSQEYNLETIIESNEHYDCFIVGSDQVWNLDWFLSPFFLDFVKDDKRKIAYAASLGYSSLSKERENFFSSALKNFESISVREKDAVSLLQPLTQKTIEWVLDPVFLLSEEEWSAKCRSRMIESNYLFCYFLGDDKSMRKVAKQYAKKYGLRLVTLPHLNGVNGSDLFFGDEQLYKVNPFDFISLIKDSSCVFTDSFHASAFSAIFKKNFIAFNRVKMKTMSGRIKSLVSLLKCEDHFLEDEHRFNLESLLALSDIDYSVSAADVERMKEKSINFLKKSLDYE